MKKTLARGMRLPKPDTFERMLASIPTSDVVGSVYYTGRLLQRRNDLLDVYQGFRVPNISSEPTDKQQEIAFDLLRRIEREEEVPVQKLSDSQAGKYIVRLSKIVRDRTRADYGGDDSRGLELLADLRSRYNGATA